MYKRILKTVIAVALIVGLLPISTYAEGNKAATFDVGDKYFFEVEPNDYNAIADEIADDYTVVASLTEDDEIDGYTFTLDKESDVMVTVASEEESLLVGIYDSSDELLVVGKDYGYDDEYYYDIIYMTLAAGTYYMYVIDENTPGVAQDYLFYFDVVDEEVKEVVRISGKNRYETSDKIIYNFKESMYLDMLDTLIIASGTGFPDALAGSYLASTVGAPILLTDGNLNISWFEEHVREDAMIYILGGTGVVPSKVEKLLEKDYQVERLYGKNRYETNLRILEEAFLWDGYTGEVLICTGKNFADSLSASATGCPILLVGESLTTAQKSLLNSLDNSDFYILGGTGAVSEDIEAAVSEYGTVKRIGGKSRYETSVNIAKEFFYDPSNAVLAYAMNYPDGLCGGPLAITLGLTFESPLILTSNGNQSAAKQYVEENEIMYGYVLGGASLISDNTVKDIFGITDDELILYDSSKDTSTKSRK